MVSTEQTLAYVKTLAGMCEPLIVLAIDPGKRYLGAAATLDGVIRWCGYVSPIETIRTVAEALRPSVLVIEKPQQYYNSKAARRDITDLTLATGEIKAYVSAPKVVAWEPREWKGQVPKDIHQARIFALMTESERALLPRLKGQRGHVLDACGLALRYAGRL